MRHLQQIAGAMGARQIILRRRETREAPDEPGRKYLRAIDPQTGKIVWQYSQIGPGNSWGGALSTAGGLVFFGEDSGAFAAVDAKSGKSLWYFHTNELWKASPMTYMAGGKQYVAVAAGSNILVLTILARINQRLPESLRERLFYLRAKREDETITDL